MTSTRTISFTLNGEAVSAAIAPHHTLLEVVRNSFNLFGARESCGQGLCGCCTLIVDGREAVTFLVRVKESLEEPSRLVLDL
jgi:aerobic-type carbon monoxide dehydrogenase small subunit (CoxS/CutS family)